jgi:hypothetical protein
MNMQYTLLTLLFFGTLCLSCDYEASGEICNRTEDSVELLLHPVVAIHEYPVNEGKIMVKTTQPTDTGHFISFPKQCVHVASQYNAFTEAAFEFSYLEIRTKTDTTIFDSKEKIRKAFRELNQEEFRYDVN